MRKGSKTSSGMRTEGVAIIILKNEVKYDVILHFEFVRV